MPTSLFDIANFTREGFERGKARADQSTLGRLMGQGYQQPQQRSSILAQMAQVNPDAAVGAQKAFGADDDAKMARVGQLAGMLISLPDEASRKAAYPQVVQGLHSIGLGEGLPPEWSDNLLPYAQQLYGQVGGASGVQSTFTDDAGNRVAIMRDGSTKVLGRSDPGMANQSITIEGPNGEPIQLTFNKRTGSYADVPGAVGMGAGEKAAVTEAAKQDVDLSFAPRFQAIETGGAIERARGSAQAQADVTRQTAQRQKAQAFDQFETAMKGVESGLGGTTTNPVAGSLPALTANQQIAEGSIAAMAPILKQLFRVAGEGTFTDRDQALLMDMLPTRKDHPEARKAKIANIRAIVAAKLGATPSAAGTDNDAARRKALLDKY